MKNIRMAVLDLDGTVLHRDRSISPYTQTVLQACRKKGIYIAVATARSKGTAKPFLEKLAPDIVISNGGALAEYNGKILYQYCLSAEDADGIVVQCRKRDDFSNVTVETDTGYYVSWKKPQSEEYTHAVYWDFAAPLHEKAYKISVELTNGVGIDQIAARYPSCRLTSFFGQDWYRFSHKKAGKMEAIQKAAQVLKIEVSQIAAFGDDFMDLDMIKGCGVGVAMENGNEAIKRAADFICPSNDRDGAAKWLEEFVLHAK